MDFLRQPRQWRSYPKVLFIHGFATHVRFSIFRQARTDGDTGFEACRDLIEAGFGKVFEWGLAEEANWLQSLNPFYIHHVYTFEQLIAHSPSVHQELNEMMREFEPEIVFCHSMGAELLFDFLREYRLSLSVRKIVFVQADISSHVLVHDVGLREKIIQNGIPIVNVFCPWDPSLLFSSWLHEDMRAGLVGLDFPDVVNILWPLWRLPNLHMSSLKSKWLRDILLA